MSDIAITNFTTALFLINRDLRAIAVNYDPTDKDFTGTGDKKLKTVLFKSLDQSIRVDDLVVIPTKTRHGFTVAKVIEVDVSVDFNDTTPMTWIVAKVDDKQHKVTLDLEEDAIAQMKQAEFNRRRESLFNSMVSAADQAKIKQLPLFKNGSHDEPHASNAEDRPQPPAPKAA